MITVRITLFYAATNCAYTGKDFATVTKRQTVLFFDFANCAE